MEFDGKARRVKKQSETPHGSSSDNDMTVTMGGRIGKRGARRDPEIGVLIVCDIITVNASSRGSVTADLFLCPASDQTLLRCLSL